MMNSFVLIKNLKSNSEELTFADFKFLNIKSIWDYDLKRAQQLFPKAWPFYKDWIYVRGYEDDNSWEKIPFDIEDTLLLLRLFKPGDLVFLQPCIENAKGELSCQLPYRVMTNVHSAHEYKFQQDECNAFDEFACEIRVLRNWESVWFQTARRFFLYGGGKEYRPIHYEVDRIVDYITVLECILAPERNGFIGKRLRERAVSLLELSNIERENTKRLLKDFYNVRSTIVHGSDVSSVNTEVFKKNIDLEIVVRQILIKALRYLPVKEKDRISYLKSLFDISDKDRTEKVFSDFCSVKDEAEKRKCFDLIANRLDCKVSYSSKDMA